jgi:hypothetical protein
MRPVDNRRIAFHTKGMKIAISIPDDLGAEVDRIAKSSHIPRSRVFVVAVREQLKELESKCLLESLNDVYSTPDTPGEVEARSAFQSQFFKKVIRREDFED